MIIYIKKYRIYFDKDNDTCAKEDLIMYLDNLCSKCPLSAYCCTDISTNDEILDDIIYKCAYSRLIKEDSEPLFIRSITPINIYKLFL